MCKNLISQRGQTFSAIVGIIAVLVSIFSISIPVFAGCASCQGIAGLGVEVRDGATWALPIADAWDLGPGGPGRADAKTLPISGGLRNFGTIVAPHIEMGDNTVITIDSGHVLVDGVQRPLWNWTTNAGTTGTLTTPGKYAYVFNSNGFVTNSSGPGGLRTTSFTYDTTRTDCISSVTDSYGNVWNYGVPTGQHEYAPTYVENPDQTKKIEFVYAVGGSNGAGQYDQVTVKKKVSGNWVEQSRADYGYDSDHRIAQIITSVPAGETSTTVISYYTTDQAGRAKPVQRIHNEKLQVDLGYIYSTANISQNGTLYTYGVTTVRRRANYGSDTDSLDQVTKYYYYHDSSDKDAELFRVIRQQYNGSSWEDYSTVEYRRYGYNNRFTDGNKPTSDPSVLRGLPWKFVDGRNKETKYNYSTENGLVTKVTLPSFDEINYSYVQDGTNDTEFVQQVIDARGIHIRYTRDQNHPSLVTKIEVSRNGTSWSTVKEMSYYDATIPEKAYLLHTVTVPDIGDGSEDMVTTYDYEDPEGGYRPQPTQEEYEWYNFDAGTPGYETAQTHTSFYADSRIRWDRDALGGQTDYDYDNESRLIRTLAPVDQEDMGTVDTATSTTITDNGKTWYTDQLKGMTLAIDYDGTIIDYLVSGNDENTITIASGDTTYAQGKDYTVRPVSSLVYSECCGQVAEEADGVGRKTYYQYNDQGQVWRIRNSETTSGSAFPLVQYTYNDLGQKTQVTTYTEDNSDAGRTTVYTYDQLGRVKQIDHPTNGGIVLLWSEYYQYDEADNIVAKLVGTVSAGNVTTGSVTAYQYDSNGRLASVQHNYQSSVWPVTSGLDSYGDISVNADVWYTFDGGSNLKDTMHDITGTSYYGYDESGRLNYYKPGGDEYEVYYTYNAAGQKTSVAIRRYDEDELDWFNRYQTAYTYFQNGWLKQVKGQKYVSGNWTDVTQVNFEYDAAGNVTKRRNNKDAQTPDIVTEYTYNARSEAVIIDHKASGTSKYALVYSRDGVATPLQIELGGNSFQNAYTYGNIVRYGYDPVGRLTAQTWGHDSGGWQQDHADTWNYDWVGNRNPGSNNYNQVDELTAYQYDKLGNIEYDPDSSATERTHYHYNAENLLSQIDYINEGSSTTTTTTMTWDADQQRVQIANNSGTWKMLYDPSAGVPAVLVTGNDYYVRTPDGELLASFTDGETTALHYYHSDNLGSIVLVTDGSANTSTSKTYDAWGATLAGTGTAVPYGYVGELGYYTHTSSQGPTVDDLFQLGVRFYDPEIGRFTQRDPIKSDEPLRHVENDVITKYGYCRSRPVLSNDPWGLWPGWKPIPVPAPVKGGGCADLACQLLTGNYQAITCVICCYELQLYLNGIIGPDASRQWATACATGCNLGTYIPWNHLPKKWKWW